MLAGFAAAAPATAEVRFADAFTGTPVLQRGVPLPVWGRATPGAEVRVSFARQRVVTTTGPDGVWRVRLQPLAASAEPQRMTAQSGDATATVEQVLVGDVWLVAGQSNAEWRLVHSEGGRDALRSAPIPGLRLLVVEPSCAAEPRETVRAIWRKEGVEGAWQPSTPFTANRVGALGFHFGVTLRRELGVPIGIIQTAVGGTRIEAWSPPALFGAGSTFRADSDRLTQALASHRQREAETRDRLRLWLEGGVQGPPPEWPIDAAAFYNRPTCFYNAMLAGLVPYGLRGVLWYQGESNVPEGAGYAPRLRAFVRGMRAAWGDARLPFGIVQLAPFAHPTSDALPLVWEAQRQVAGEGDAGLITHSDLVTDVTDLHPPAKRPLAERAARWALAAVYRRPDRTPTGPVAVRHAIEGSAVRIWFDSATGLTTRFGDAVDSVELVDAAGAVHPASARIEGETIVVWHPNVARPGGVRFGWRSTARPNLMNAAGLPAASFRLPEGIGP